MLLFGVIKSYYKIKLQFLFGRIQNSFRVDDICQIAHLHGSIRARTNGTRYGLGAGEQAQTLSLPFFALFRGFGIKIFVCSIIEAE